MTKPRLLFVSPRFLLPADSGGKIRTTEILKRLKGGAFHVTLLSPAPANWLFEYRNQIDELCDEFVSASAVPDKLHRLRTYLFLLASTPASVRADRQRKLERLVNESLNRSHVTVFDFPHAAINYKGEFRCPSLLFTHNIEAEIYSRHALVAKNPVMKMIWQSQHRKMERYEQSTFSRFDGIVAVSARDKAVIAETAPSTYIAQIDTGVDLDYFEYHPPQRKRQVVFLGSMDWVANIDGIEFLLDFVWPRVVSNVPEATMTVVGRSPPKSLVSRATQRYDQWHFTGRVDDVRPWVSGADAFVIPLRVGGGTRIKAYEAAAMGCPIVSTTIGIEGLDLDPGVHFLSANDADAFADSIIELLTNHDLGHEIAQTARAQVESRYGWQAIAHQFEDACSYVLAPETSKSQL